MSTNLSGGMNKPPDLERSPPMTTETALDQQVSIHVLRSVEEDPHGWDAAAPADNLFLQRPYLRALEAHPPKGIQFRYAIIRQGNMPLGVVYTQLLYFNGAESIRYQQSSGRPACFFSTFGQFLRGLVARQVGFYSLVCGNLMLSGEHGFAFQDDNCDHSALVDQAMRQIRRSLEEENIPASILLIKDFYPEHLETIDRFKDYQYHAFHILPSMVMTLDPSWSSYADYLGALSSKYRVRAKKARKVMSKDVQRRMLSLQDVHELQPQLHALYQEIADDSGFNVITLDKHYFTQMKAALGDDFLVQGYFREGQLIGFLSGVINLNGEFEAHFLGYANQWNPSYKLYLNMLLDLVELAIQHRSTSLIFARTAEEIKSSVGAKAVNLTCYIRHRSSFTNRFIRPLLDYLNPVDDWVPRHPFKQED